LSASEGQQTSREDGRDERQQVVWLSGGTDEEAVEVLEGEQKARSDDQLEGKPTRGHSPEDAMVHTER
jgi:hypothetical protein